MPTTCCICHECVPVGRSNPTCDMSMVPMRYSARIFGRLRLPDTDGLSGRSYRVYICRIIDDVTPRPQHTFVSKCRSLFGRGGGTSCFLLSPHLIPVDVPVSDPVSPRDLVQRTPIITGHVESFRVVSPDGHVRAGANTAPVPGRTRLGDEHGQHLATIPIHKCRSCSFCGANTTFLMRVRDGSRGWLA